MQLPLPEHISEEKVIDTISYDKDVDGFHPVNVGNLFIGKDSFVPCTPAGIIELIKSTGTQIEGKRAVVIGRSNIVGKPVAQLLLNENATVTIAHSRTKDLPQVAKEADILVVATGLAKFVKKTISNQVRLLLMLAWIATKIISYAVMWTLMMW